MEKIEKNEKKKLKCPTGGYQESKFFESDMRSTGGKSLRSEMAGYEEVKAGGEEKQKLEVGCGGGVG